ncbi:glycosyltransferase family 4 protein [Halococcoides cellulosivorans]|uniref:Glycosyltransferase family 1 protein n=1 Tax=Halococcoides cellulosivorans TaxID=1679096 RepID=A0A2R4X044_9EURY|nr:glycosyltransferase family 1 protein [Halococcoides cellulosivorans]AWB27135.1 hypothetical protein HARCEL1_05145 [Halococcoides cellulosivorans]
MRIGVNARTFSVDEPGGSVQSMRKITRELIQRDDVSVVLYGNSCLSGEFPNATQVHSGGFFSNSPFFGVLWERTVLPMLVDADEIDVLLCPNGNAPPVGVGVPIVTYVHDVNALKGMSSWVHQIYRRTMVPLGVRNSEAIVTVSEFSKGEIVDHLPVDPEDVHVVYNGVDEFFLQDGGSEPMDLPDDYFLYVGAMNPRKNVRRLVDAYTQIHDEIDQKLVLIGPRNKSMFKTMDVEASENIITPGFVPRPQLKYAYENADAFLFPSLYEGFGLPPLEAMACGTPVIAANSSSLPEILDGHATFVDPYCTEDIEDALCDNDLNDNEDDLVCHSNKFTWDDSTDQLFKILTNYC